MKHTPIFAIVIIAGLTGCTLAQKGAQQTDPLVQTVQVQSGASKGVVVYPGRTVADESAGVAFHVSGTISNIYVEPGQNIQKGQVIASLDTRDYQTQLNATEAEYAQIKAEVERVMAMYEDDAVTANDYDKARYGLTQIQQKLNHHRSQLADCSLIAPYDGCIGNVNYHMGETVVAGVPVVTLFNGNDIELVIDLSSTDYLRRNDIISAVASFKIFPDVEFPLEIKSIARSANANQLYQARYVVKGNTEELTPGMTALVTLSFKASAVVTNDVELPSNSIFEKNGESMVYVFDEETSRINSKTVNISKIDAAGNAVVTGIEAGEIVVSAGVSKLYDGQKVRLVQPASDTNPGGLL